MISTQSYYQILDVPANASPEEIKTAFRKLAMQYHPDRNTGSSQAEAIFKLINNAYNILADREKRAAYDVFLSTSNIGRQRGAAAGGAGRAAGAALPDNTAEALFSQFNILLWDLEDFLRKTDDRAFKIRFSGSFLWCYTVKVLDFIDKWLFDPAQYREYLADTFYRNKSQLQNYFYHLRLKLDKFFNRLNFNNLLQPLTGYPVTKLDCILEVQQHTIHYLTHMQLAANGQAGEIPRYRFSPIFLPCLDRDTA